MTFLNFPKFFIIAVIGCLTMPGVLLGPAIVGILVDNANFSENYAGWAMACSSAGSALTLIVISGFMHQINLKQLSYICLSLAFLIDIYCSFKVDPSIHFLVLRFIIGVVATIANISVYTSIASFKNYERGYGLFVMMQYSASGLGLYYLILYADVIGASGLYQILAALNLIALLLINQLPDLNTHTQTMKNETSEIAVLFSKVVVIAIIGFGLHEMSSVAQFTFIERVGASIGIENQSLGNILLAGSLVGIPGSMICIVIGNKYGLLPPMLFAISCCIVGMSIFLIEKSYLTYTLRMCLIGFGFSMALPFIQSHLASLDKKGSALAAGNSLATIGAALGAGLGASLLGQDSNYRLLLEVSMLIYISAAVCIIVSILIRSKQH